MAKVVGGVIGGVVGAVGGFLIGGVGGAIMGGIGGAEAGVAIGSAIEGNQQAQQNVGDFGNPATPPPAGTSPPDTSTPTQPKVQGGDEAAIAAERYAEAQTQIGSMQSQISTAILGEKVAEVKSEGGITASTAARGLKMEGSPMMQMIAQKQMGEQAIAYTQGQGTAAISGARTGAQASFDAAALAGKEKIQYADQQLSNAWLGAFTNVLNTTTGLVNKFWNPAQNVAASDLTYLDVGGGGPRGEGGIGYYGY